MLGVYGGNISSTTLYGEGEIITFGDLAYISFLGSISIFFFRLLNFGEMAHFFTFHTSSQSCLAFWISCKMFLEYTPITTSSSTFRRIEIFPLRESLSIDRTSLSAASMDLAISQALRSVSLALTASSFLRRIM